jgi:hypothetical protein
LEHSKRRLETPGRRLETRIRRTEYIPLKGGGIMPSSKDYVPSNDGRFLQWAKKLVTETVSHAAAWEVNAENRAEPAVGAFLGRRG